MVARMSCAVVRIAALVAFGAACQGSSSDRLQSGQDDALLARGIDTRASTYKDPEPPRTAPPPVSSPGASAVPAREHVEPPVVKISGETRNESIPGLKFRVPVEWVRRPDPENPAHPVFIIPGPLGQGELVVHRFADDDASGEFQRWRARAMKIARESAGGRGEAREMVRGPLRITVIDFPGSRAAEVMPVPLHRPAGAEDRLMGAIVEGDDRRYFLVAVGPAPTMTLWEQAFADFTATFAVDFPP